MTMNRLTLILGGVVIAALLFVGGVAIGDVLADDAATAEADTPTSRQVAAATPADGAEIPEPGTDPSWPATSPLQILDPAEPTDPDGTTDEAAASTPGLSGAELAALYDPETGIDSDATGEPFIPPTSPAFDPETDEVDPESPAVAEDGVEPLTPDEVEDLLTPEEPEAPEVVFSDPCADAPEAGVTGSDDTGSDDGGDDEADAACPFGTGGTIVLTGGGDPVDPLRIMRQLYTFIAVPLELRCSPLGTQADGTYQAILPSNNPATFTIRYWPSTEPDAVRTVTFETTEQERDRWIERRLAGERVGADMHTGIHNCIGLPGVFPGRHTTVQVHGVDDLGTEHEVTIYVTPESNRDGVAVGRPHASFTPVDQRLGLVTVPYDERTEQVYVASLPRTGARATTESCTDIENDVLARRHYSDLSILDSSVTEFPRTDDDGYEPGIESSVVTRFVAEEGTTYEICTWVTKPPRRSFDKPPVVLRDTITVRGPRHHRVRIWFAGGHSDVPLAADALTVRTANWGWERGLQWPDEPARATAFFLEEPLLVADSGSGPVPSSTLLEVVGPEGDRLELSVPTPTHCAIGIFGCVREGYSHYDIPIPGGRVGTGLCGSSFGECEPPSREVFLGNVRVLVETYSGPGGPPDPGLLGDQWDVDPQTTFTPSGAFEVPLTPQIDQNQTRLTAITPREAGGRPGLHAVLHFDRPVQVTAVPRVAIGYTCPIEAVPQSTTEPQIVVAFEFPDMCWGSTYWLDVLATDADGNVLDARSVVDGVATGRRAVGLVDMPTIRFDEIGVRVTVNQIGDGLGASRAEVTVGGVASWDLASGSGVQCIADGEVRELGIVRNAGGYPIRLGDPLVVYVRLRGQGDGEDCGESTARVDHDWLTATIPLDQLVNGATVTASVTAEDGTDIQVELHSIRRSTAP
jgi:hypothetical protein